MDGENHDCIHETDFNKLRRDMNNGYKSINELKDDNVLIKEALGIKNRENGERDKQIKEAYKKMSVIGEKAEEEDKNLRQLIQETREDMAEIKGFLQGSNEVKKDKKSWHQQIISVSFAQVLGFIFSIIILLIVAYTCL
jgi:Fe2+ transport system protein B